MIKKENRNTLNKIIISFVLMISFVVNISLVEASVEKRNVNNLPFSESEEMVLGEHMKNMLSYKREENSNIIHIFNEIVKANPDQLHLQDGKKNLYLNEPSVIDDVNLVNAVTIPGGNIMISKGLINIVNMKEEVYDASKVKETGNYLRNNSPNNIYNNSSVGFYLAHEMSHWYNRDWVYMSSLNKENESNIGMIKSILFKGNPSNLTEQTLSVYVSNVGASNNKLDDVNFQLEKLADKNGCYFLTNTEDMSVGSAIYGFWKIRKNLGIANVDDEADNPKRIGGKHPSTLFREKTIFEEYIKTPLKDRVDFDFDNRILYVDGQKWFKNGYGVATAEVPAMERTLYVIGQIASIRSFMDNHNKNDIKSFDVVERPIIYLNNQISNNQTLVYASIEFNNGEKYTKLIDKFNLDYNRVSVLLQYKTLPTNDEERYFFYELGVLKELTTK